MCTCVREREEREKSDERERVCVREGDVAREMQAGKESKLEREQASMRKCLRARMKEKEPVQSTN